jgi:hypothetical protein
MIEPFNRLPRPSGAGQWTEIRFAIDANEPPRGCPVANWPDPEVTELGVEIVAHGAVVTVTLPIDEAKMWSRAFVAAVAAAHREAFGDPDVLFEDDELGDLPILEEYEPRPGILVRADTDGTTALVRFHVAVDIEGTSLSTTDLRDSLVGHLVDRFNVADVLVSAGEVLRGTAWSFGPSPD